MSAKLHPYIHDAYQTKFMTFVHAELYSTVSLDCSIYCIKTNIDGNMHILAEYKWLVLTREQYVGVLSKS